ncbi:MAG: type II secretion system protein M [Legionella sp.]|nr:MAG: type II secretion system protein M [Legionella sp.]
MKDYFNSLNEREKWMVLIAGVCLVVYSFYYFIYSPLSTRVSDRSTQLVEKIDTLNWMKKIKQEHHSLKKKQNISNSQLLTLIANQLKKDNTLNFPFQLQQTSSGEIQLSFDEVPLSLFVAWLMKINDQYAISIKQFDIERTKTAGIVKLMIIINGVA